MNVVLKTFKKSNLHSSSYDSNVNKINKQTDKILQLLKSNVTFLGANSSANVLPLLTTNCSWPAFTTCAKSDLKAVQICKRFTTQHRHVCGAFFFFHWRWLKGSLPVSHIAWQLKWRIELATLRKHDNHPILSTRLVGFSLMLKRNDISCWLSGI